MNRATLPFAAVLAACLLAPSSVCQRASGGASMESGLRTSDRRKPVIRTSLDDVPFVFLGDSLCFTVEVRAADSDRVSVRLKNPVAGLVFPPRIGVASGTECAGVYEFKSHSGLRRLVFEAVDERSGRRNEHVVELQVLGRARGSGANSNRALALGDLTGDGVADILGGGEVIDLVAQDAGAMYLWSKDSAPSAFPGAAFTPHDALAGERMGNGDGNERQLADLNGDGVLDLVVTCRYKKSLSQQLPHGEVLIWFGGRSYGANEKPHATLTTGEAGAQLSRGSGQGVLLKDVDGDKIKDVLAVSTYAYAGGVRNSGAVYFWRGGGSLAGNPVSPTATLRSSSPEEYDLLGATSGQGILVADVTGDGREDIVVAAGRAEDDAGALYVWDARSDFTGDVFPSATLTASSATRLSEVPGGYSLVQGFYLEDVTGDGVRDVIAVSPQADVNGVTDAGAAYVWRGGKTLAGRPAPLATLTVPTASSGDALGSAANGVQVYDVTGDGIADLLVGTSKADVGGVTDTGALYVWKGGASLAGAPNPSASLFVPGAKAGDQLGGIGTGGNGFGSYRHDVTGDGVLDVIVRAPFADRGSVRDAGAIYVWAGGSTLTGSLGPTATLLGQGATDDLYGIGKWNTPVGDVTGDGIDDIVVGNYRADVNGKSDSGRVDVWEGGPSLTGTASTWFRYGAPAPAGGELIGLTIDLVDLSGDGVLDLVFPERDFSGSVPDRILVFHGGPTLATSTAASVTYRNPDGMPAFEGLDFGLFDERTGDGHLDVVAISHNTVSPTTGQRFAGAAFVFPGGPDVSGETDPHSSVINAAARGCCESMGEHGLLIDDVTGDGITDIVLLAPDASSPSAGFAGAFFVWPGGEPGTNLAPRRLEQEFPSPGDMLGF